MPDVAILMGSKSDYPIMQKAEAILDSFGISYETHVMSAHRNPEGVAEFARAAANNGFKAFIAGAGGAAHLPCVIAALTTLPVIGVPCRSAISIDGWASILSILQMPSGIPVATVGLDASKNAALLATQIIGTQRPEVHQKLVEYKEQMRQDQLAADASIQKETA